MGRSFENRKASMAKTQGAKVRVYSRYGKEIYVSAKNGGADPDTNITLRRLIEKAKKDQVPTHVIDRAIEKASGAGGENYENARYEGFGPGGCMVIVDCLTDNNKRTYTEVRNCFVKTNSKIGSTGTVGHMFDHLAILRYAGEDEDAAYEALLEADVDVTDIECEDGKITVFAPHTEFFKAKNALLAINSELEFEVEEITFVAQTETEVTGEDVATFEKFTAMLDDCDDVQSVYHNAIIA
ncbi:YebC/PmpR family DNA-binding transcriptional regulator [Psychrobium sp. 1_MG-2023]|uniref:YebC/PmpR family DNA-binding transcriptional regulator n=1 Tax=Psychrobium sp. 1_MG-2023 TaxID=3062624 RepID=UPI000C33DE3C|nr:YebC/PmpR family DNA-binding transcriptional regulator [Psychrobium sp. 1_MG-2023]MDP2561673.1 YebC/PmpR family DNA-binding transcriptional regulator [Psychrobium sp. 1_MG-2023]PKF57077.1 YebC/PmpR family DNA-binding transcriptional regulator [Alteromonadales bacterium alter-6D02]